MLNAISPIDGRYQTKTTELREYYSEEALIRWRVFVEVEYLIFLGQLKILQLNEQEVMDLRLVRSAFSEDSAKRVKEIEKVTNHDVKAVEYYIKEELAEVLSPSQLEFVHFGLTSQDINNTALPLLIKESIETIMLPTYRMLLSELRHLGMQLSDVPMLARTHGQPASPTTMGKEIRVFAERIDNQLKKLDGFQLYAKFSGATGNFNAHKLAYPDIPWPEKTDQFIASLGLKRHSLTTQIAHYDDLSELFQVFSRTNVILIDMCRDLWTYISMNYFTQKMIKGEIGSSAMPHKVNPIDFENAEGNLGLANCLFNFLSSKLPISRLQRDLTDSTVTRNIGVPFAHSLIALKSILKGLQKLRINKEALAEDLENSWPVIAEGIQTILRREGFMKPYELLKDFSRGKSQLGREDFRQFINGLDVSQELKDELLAVSPHNYLGTSGDQ